MITKRTVKSQLETALKYKLPLNSNRGLRTPHKIRIETALELQPQLTVFE